jgi:hypothetical protein
VILSIVLGTSESILDGFIDGIVDGTELNEGEALLLLSLLLLVALWWVVALLWSPIQEKAHTYVPWMASGNEN